MKTERKKLSPNKKKAIVLVSMVLLLAATGVLNYFINVNLQKQEDAVPTGLVSQPVFFDDFRDVRSVTRETELEELDNIIATAATAETVAQAEAQKLHITMARETEFMLESLIKARGFDDAVVTISQE
ncbi:MAG: SpoIIIAH-like family protein, partial [Christensenellaceae bacterium]|nr:SpoIIIAH-like family protein [Christensenellaceae bacterium]